MAIPELELILNGVDYRCAIQKEILVQGKLYVSENHLSFRGSVFGELGFLFLSSFAQITNALPFKGYDINFHIPWTEVLSIKRTMTGRLPPFPASLPL